MSFFPMYELGICRLAWMDNPGVGWKLDKVLVKYLPYTDYYLGRKDCIKDVISLGIRVGLYE